MEKNKNELISIIVPIYNVENYLQKCVESILNQTYHNIEIILVDDGSTDNSKVLCDALAEKNLCIKVVHKKNGGLSSARNAGISAADGKYLGFIDSDDYIEKEMFSVLYEAIRRTGKDIACCGRVVDIFGEYSNREFTLEKEKIYSRNEAIKEVLYLEKIDVSACDKLYKRRLFNRIKYPEGRISEDAAVIFDLLELSNGVVHVGKAFYHYVFRNNSITKSQYSNKKQDVLYNLEETRKFIINNHPELIRDCNIYCTISASALILDMNRDIEAKKKNKKHYSECWKYFNKGIWDAILSPKISIKMKLRLMAIKTHTVWMFFAGKQVYASLRKWKGRKICG